MIVTLYEVETTIRKAAIGTGFPIGLAEDISCAAAWLIGRDHDCMKPLLQAIGAGMGKTDMHANDKEALVFPDARIAVCGPSAIDLLIGEKTCKEIYLLNPDSATLLVGLAGVAANHHNLEFHFSFSNGVNVQMSASEFKEIGMVPTSGCDIVLTCCKADQAVSKAPTPTRGIEVDNEIWREAEALAAKTYVPESKASRSTGAGAGLTDND